MRFWKKWLQQKPGESADAVASEPLPGEPFEHTVKLAYLTPQGKALVWKTSTISSDGDSLWMKVPDTEWEQSLPQTDAVTVYLLKELEAAEFDSVIQRVVWRDGATYLKAQRPASLQWKKSESTGSFQKRKFLRVEVALPATCALPHSEEQKMCRLLDLSMEGAAVLLDFEPPPDTVLDIKVLAHALPLQVQGKVIRAIPFQSSAHKEFSFNASIAFVNQSEVIKDMIGTFILNKQKDLGVS